ncbi:MAG TPA: peptidoglycan DD-metalloendopeptidase family protein [Gammaproteobacteria bacterium]|nr:peptidoglycan DD-metalloendopeptidase family protein [Gammaproteobacteria bacterium]
MIACLLSGAPAVAGDADNEAKLGRVRERIEILRSEMRADVEKRDALAARLRDSEEQLAAASRALESIRDKRVASERRLDELVARQSRHQTALARERATLARQIRSAYMNGRQERLKLMLSQQDAAALGRLMVYYGYFNRLRAGRIESVATRLAELDRLGADLGREQARLHGLETARAAELEELETARRERAASLSALAGRIAARGGEVAGLEANAQALEKLVEELRRALADLPVTGQQPFDEVRGRLAWPVEGRLISDFGEPRAGGRLKWNGVLIGAERGAEVRAIHHGRVAYAGWLPGLGLLLVIEHGGGYLSLYGHNLSLARDVGDLVAPGAVIGRVGDSGGRAEPALYFEIRRAREPLDPHGWIARKLVRR